MLGNSFGHGLGSLGLPFGGGRLPPPRAMDGGAREEFLGPEVNSSNHKIQFPVQAGIISGGLAIVGDGAAQFYSRFESRKKLQAPGKTVLNDEKFWEHDWIRSLRMGGYGFLLYGPISHFWYQYLDHLMPVKNFTTFSIKTVLNQIVFGPMIISVVFAWNCAWLGRLNALPNLYRYQAPTALTTGWKFWTPMSFINFGLVPLEHRVLFMSTCAICWNFYLSDGVSSFRLLSIACDLPDRYDQYLGMTIVIHSAYIQAELVIYSRFVALIQPSISEWLNRSFALSPDRGMDVERRFHCG